MSAAPEDLGSPHHGKPATAVSYTHLYYVEPTVFKGHNRMRIFQEEIFGPVVSVTTFKNESDALEIANDTLYGLGAGLWTCLLYTSRCV